MPSFANILRILGVVLAAIMPGGSLILALALAPSMLRRLRRFEPSAAPKGAPARQ